MNFILFILPLQMKIQLFANVELSHDGNHASCQLLVLKNTPTLYFISFQMINKSHMTDEVAAQLLKTFQTKSLMKSKI